MWNATEQKTWNKKTPINFTELSSIQLNDFYKPHVQYTNIHSLSTIISVSLGASLSCDTIYV